MSRKPATKAPPSFDDLPDDGFVRLPVVLSVWPIGKSSWHRGVAEGKYPKPVKVAARTAFYRVGDIRKLLASASATIAALLVLVGLTLFV
jgi:predicted DNA-binding transcriptional regulator AlpA